MIKIKEVVKFAVFASIAYLGLVMAADTDPARGALIKFIGFGSIVYFSAKVIYPDNFL